LRERPAVLCRIQAHLKAPLSEAAALNSLRWELFRRVQATGYFDLTTRAGTKQVVAASDVVAIQRNDGYSYANGLEEFPLQAGKGGGPRS
jgi:hypothetical protein